MTETTVLARDALATKGEGVEEWVDLRFFRPLGARIARAAFPTWVSPDHLTLVCLLIGLVAGHLFYYASPWLNAGGFALFIVSDIFDSADGQLARLRGSSTPLGRVLDGVSDNTRFINLYAHLLARLLVSGWAVAWALPLVLFAGLTHSMQSSAIDFVRNAFLAIGVGRGGPLASDDPSAAGARPSPSWAVRFATRLYDAYVERQQRMFPRTWALVCRANEDTLSAAARASYRRQMAPLLKGCAWLGQNFRFLLVGVLCVARWPAGVMWVTAIPLNLVALAIVVGQERVSARVTATVTDSPAPRTAPHPQWHIAGR